MSLWIVGPCGFAIHRVTNCGSATRADYKSAFTASGIANPRGNSKRTNPRGQNEGIPQSLHREMHRQKTKGKDFHRFTKRKSDSLVFVNFYLYLY